MNLIAYRSGPHAALTVLSLLALAPQHASSQLPDLVRNIGTIEALDQGSNPKFLATVGPRALFAATSWTAGRELFSTDGTPEETSLLLDLCEGSCGSDPEFVATFRGRAIFSASLGVTVSSRNLVASDGTPAGTEVLLPTDLDLHLFATPGSNTSPVVAGDELYFLAYLYAEDRLLLGATDGTSGGAREVATILPEGSGVAYISGLTTADDVAVVIVNRADYRVELWRTAGSGGGAARFAVLPASVTWASGPIFSDGPHAFFQTSGESGPELWVTDGTEAGTRQLTDLAADTAQLGFEVRHHAGRSYFLVDDVIHGQELWQTDGTPSGTGRITEFGFAEPFGSYLSAYPLDLGFIGDRVYFWANDGLSHRKIWSSDGDPASLSVFLDTCSEPSICGYGIWLEQIEDRLIHILETPDGIRVGSSKPGSLLTLLDSCVEENCFFEPRVLGRTSEGLVLSIGEDSSRGLAWVTNGLPAGTRRLMPPAGPGSLPWISDQRSVMGLGELTLIAAATPGSGTEPWVATSSPDSAVQLAELNAGAEPNQFELVMPAFDGLAFVHPPVSGGYAKTVWRSDGTEAGTLEIPGAVDPCNGFYYAAPPLVLPSALIYELCEDHDLWSLSDDSGAWTLLMPPVPNSNYYESKEVYEGIAYLARFENSGGVRVLRSDGTPAGTSALVDLPSETFEADPATLAVVNGRVVLGRSSPASSALVAVPLDAPSPQVLPTPGLAGNGAPQLVDDGERAFFAAGADLWITDGTPSGTARLVTVEWPLSIAAVFHLGAGTFLLLSEPTGLNLWQTNGTPSGTSRVATLEGTVSETVQEIAFLGGQAYFLAYDYDDLVLWGTGGTQETTRQVVALHHEVGNVPRGSRLAATDHFLVFPNYDPAHGLELWRSDGTTAGTSRWVDIYPGPSGSSPDHITRSGGKVYFTADDGVHGTELWAVSASPGAACDPGVRSLCLAGGRFRVSAHWRDFFGNSGEGQAVPLTADTGYFWFFDPANTEVVLKVLDGRGVNDHHWVFYGALSNVAYDVTVVDTESGSSRRYYNGAGRYASVGDVNAFGPLGADGSTPSAESEATGTEGDPLVIDAFRSEAAASGTCTPSPTRLCLQQGRFAVEAAWRDFQGNSGVGMAQALSADTGYFWFFWDTNVEVILKVLDGRPVNDRFWVYYGALSNVEYTLTVTDTVTGAVKTYFNPAGRFASVGDNEAF